MRNKLEIELKKIDNFIDSVQEIAIRDGKITKDEKSILDEIFKEIAEYRQLIFDVLEDNVITPEEEKKIKGFQERTLNLINSKALRDGIITKDEEDLIDSLFKFINK